MPTTNQTQLDLIVCGEDTAVGVINEVIAAHRAVLDNMATGVCNSIKRVRREVVAGVNTAKLYTDKSADTLATAIALANKRIDDIKPADVVDIEALKAELTAIIKDTVASHHELTPEQLTMIAQIGAQLSADGNLKDLGKLVLEQVELRKYIVSLDDRLKAVITREEVDCRNIAMFKALRDGITAMETSYSSAIELCCFPEDATAPNAA